MKFSSSFKVGLLTLIALVMLFGVIFRVKGRAFSSADRVEIQFKDVNGMRPGAGVQMMGLRVGQVEEVKPVVVKAEKQEKVKPVKEKKEKPVKEKTAQDKNKKEKSSSTPDIQFYAPDIEKTNILPECDSQHCVRVLRMKVGDTIEVIDGNS